MYSGIYGKTSSLELDGPPDMACLATYFFHVLGASKRLCPAGPVWFSG